jgi:hypothetical protein
MVKVELLNLEGRRVQEIWSGSLGFQKDLTLNASNLASGVYFVCVTEVLSRRPIISGKVVLLR